MTDRIEWYTPRQLILRRAQFLIGVLLLLVPFIAWIVVFGRSTGAF